MNSYERYLWLNKLLKNITERQLEEFFYDVEDLSAILKIYNASARVISHLDREKYLSISEDDEHRLQDNYERAKDINSNFR